MSIALRENIPLAPYTIYKIGGPARFFVEVRSSDELKEALRWASENNISFLTPQLLSASSDLREARPTKGAGFILGAGSNILVSDRGFAGLVIKMNLRRLDLDGSGKLVAESGVSMAQAVLKSQGAGLTGFEWAIGVPGTIGGSVRGNAGCFGGEMKDVVASVDVVDARTASNFQLPASGCDFSYRDSIFKKHPEWIIVSVTLALQNGDSKEIQKKIKKITAERTEKQDIGTKSCGCIFKNVSWARKDIDKEKLLARFPELEQFKDQPSISTSYLIDNAGLKGRRVGHAFISPKHANYFVNDGGATSEEVVILIAIAKDAVRGRYMISLEEEIQYVGF